MEVIRFKLNHRYLWTLIAILCLGNASCSCSMYAEQRPASVWFYVDGIHYLLRNGGTTVMVDQVKSWNTENTLFSPSMPSYSGNVEVPSSVRYGRNTYKVVGVEYGAFYNCNKLYSVILPSSITTIKGYAFSCCSKLNHVEIKGPIDTIPSGAFLNCKSLKEVTFSECVVHIGANAFYGCTALRTIHLPQYLQTIGFDAFKRSALQELELPDEMSILGPRALSSCSKLKMLRLGRKTKQLQDNALSNCTRLKRIDILSDSLIISPSALHACTSLKELWLYCDQVLTLETSDSSSVVSILPTQITLRVPHHLKQQYQQHPLWKRFTIKELKR